MQHPPVVVALHGALLLMVSLVAGVFLRRAIRSERTQDAWHLAHAGGSGRGVLLLAVAAVLPLASLPGWRLVTFVALMLVFSWTSMAAMTIAAATGERGLRWEGSLVNRAVYALYVASAVAIFPAAGLLVVGLMRTLW